MKVLDRKFYQRDTLRVARELLGKKLVRQIGGERLSGMIVETEAYCGHEDSACHAHRGKTPRNAIMFGEPGHAYVYFTYGMHYLVNFITEEAGIPCAVLIRAIEPLEGVEQMEARRKRKGRDLTNGPAKLCEALSIDKSLYGWDLTVGDKLWVEDYKTIPSKSILAIPRVGIDYARKKDRDAHWRFIVDENQK